ncbi:MAG: tetratricopeptide repeat protein [Rubrivivax sp.]
MSDSGPIATFVFTDIEGSTRLWERDAARMGDALARHDTLTRDAVHAHRGRIVKSTGDGVHAVFDDALDAVHAVLQLQRALAAPVPDGALALQVRCGLHCGPYEARDGDFYGPVLNRAARVMGVAHGGQTLLTQAVADRVSPRLPPDASLLDLGRARLRDLEQPEHLYQLQHAGLRATFPPLRALEATPHNLTPPLDSFVGREQVLAELRALLAHTRLLTLLGMGGIGKSRLSLQLGAELLDGFADGVWLVELAPLTDAQHVPQALASALGVHESGGRPLMDALLAWVRDKQLLVILDNCEHLVQAAAELARQLLRAGPEVRVLATSRDVLQLAGETVYPVPTLAAPAADGAVDPAALLPLESVRLFVARARAAQPGFRLDAGNAAAVASICRRLDGIALALELAAARLRVLPVQAIADRLSDRFRLLTQGDRTALPRQRTLRALIDWSHELLGDAEQRLFRRLSVFAGSWSLEAAEAVAADGALPAAEVLDGLGLLVAKSLVLMDAASGRYRMLETVRAYAAERLRDSGDDAPTRDRHLAQVLALAESARQHLAGPEPGAWLARLDLERENLLAAHAWCGAAGDGTARGLQLVFATKGYWHARGLLSLGHRITLEALARTWPDDRSFGRCRALCDAAQLGYFLGRYAEARVQLDESLAIARELGDDARVAAALQPLGMVLVALGEREQARGVYAQAMALAERLGHQRLMAASVNALAQLHRAAGELDEADRLYARTLALARQRDDAESVAIALLNRAMLALTRGDAAAVRPWLREVHAHAAATGSQPVRQSLFDVAAGLAAAEGDAAGAAALYGVAQALSRRSGMRREREDEDFLQPWLELAREALGPTGFDAGQAAGEALTAEDADSWLAAVLGG